jgi:hypothetical protein
MTTQSIKQSKLLTIDRSNLTYLTLFIMLVLIRAVMALFGFPSSFQASMGEYTLVGLMVIIVLGTIGFKLSQQTGFPELWDETVSNRQRFLIPALAGLGFALFLIIFSVLQPSDSIVNQIHISFGEAVLVYTYGAIFLETVFRLFLGALLVWFVSNIILGGRAQTTVFWIVAVILSLLQPTMQLAALLQMSGPGTVLTMLIPPMIMAVVAGFCYDMTAFSIFRSSGFLAALTMRLSIYLVWHMLWGGLISGLV